MPAKPMSKGQYAKNYQIKVAQRWVSSKKGIWAARDASSPYAGRSWPADYMNGIKQHPIDSMNAVHVNYGVWKEKYELCDLL